MTKLERMSERNLLYHLCQSSEYWRGDTKPYYDELKKRLSRYIEIKVRVKRWQTILHRHQDDICAETIRRLVKRQAGFEGNSWQFRRFIQKVVYSVCADLLKKEAFDPISLDAPLKDFKHESDAITLVDVLVDPQQETPETVLMGKEDHQQTQKLVQESLSSMDELCQHLLYRAHVLNEPQKEIARDVDVSEANIRVKLLRCREALIRNLLNSPLLQNDDSNLDKIDKMIAQLPAPEDTLLLAWWQGETRWKYLSKLIDSESSQSATKALFAQGMSHLFTLLFDSRD